MTTNGEAKPTLQERRIAAERAYEIAKAQVEAFYSAQLRLLDELIAAETPVAPSPDPATLSGKED